MSDECRSPLQFGMWFDAFWCSEPSHLSYSQYQRFYLNAHSDVVHFLVSYIAMVPVSLSFFSR